MDVAFELMINTCFRVSMGWNETQTVWAGDKQGIELAVSDQLKQLSLT